MTRKEKTLYHQIHPAKLLADFGGGMVALYPLWQHELVVALLVMFISAIVASAIIIGFVDLEKYKQSAFGRYVCRYMTTMVATVRIASYATMRLGAWYHIAWLIPVGLTVVVLAWLRGVILPGKVM